MKATKFLISTAAAAAVVGAIGLAYAQTGTADAPGSSGPGPAATPSESTMPTHPALKDPPASTSTIVPMPSDSTMPTHPALKDPPATNPTVTSPTVTSPATPLANSPAAPSAGPSSTLNDATTDATSSGRLSNERPAKADRN